MFREIIIFCLCVLSSHLVASETCPDVPKVVCYYASWAFYRTDEAHFNVGDIDTSLCTHVTYTFAGLNMGLGMDSLDTTVDLGHGGYRNFTALKLANPCVKTLLAVGGWNEGSRKYSVMVSDKKSREAFVESVLRFLVMYDFDGIDVDWEYPTQRGGIPDDNVNFVELLKLLHGRLSKWNLEVSIATPIDKNVLDQGYNVADIAKYVSFVSIMAYDYTSTTSATTGLIAPQKEIEESVNYWLSNGFPSEKLILGLPSYARTYTLLDENETGIGAPTNGTGRSGIYTKERGFLSYYELQKLLQSDKYTIETTNENCYAYYKKDWFSFDSIETYEYKVNYALKNGLGGLMIWTIDTDDFKGTYGEEFTILKTIHHAIEKYSKRS